MTPTDELIRDAAAASKKLNGFGTLFARIGGDGSNELLEVSTSILQFAIAVTLFQHEIAVLRSEHQLPLGLTDKEIATQVGLSDGHDVVGWDANLLERTIKAMHQRRWIREVQQTGSNERRWRIVI